MQIWALEQARWGPGRGVQAGESTAFSALGSSRVSPLPRPFLLKFSLEIIVVHRRYRKSFRVTPLYMVLIPSQR